MPSPMNTWRPLHLAPSSANLVLKITPPGMVEAQPLQEQIVSYGLWPWRDGKVDISKLVRGGGFQLLTRSHKSYSLTSSPFNNESTSYPSRPQPQASRLLLCNKTGGDGSRVSINLALHLLPFWPKYGQEPDSS